MAVATLATSARERRMQPSRCHLNAWPLDKLVLTTGCPKPKHPRVLLDPCRSQSQPGKKNKHFIIGARLDAYLAINSANHWVLWRVLLPFIKLRMLLTLAVAKVTANW